jgi:hypothetical protein
MLTAIFYMVLTILVIQAASAVASGIYAHKSHKRMQRDQKEHERRMAAMGQPPSYDGALFPGIHGRGPPMPPGPPLRIVPTGKGNS